MFSTPKTKSLSSNTKSLNAEYLFCYTPITGRIYPATFSFTVLQLYVASTPRATLKLTCQTFVPLLREESWSDEWTNLSWLAGEALAIGWHLGCWIRGCCKQLLLGCCEGLRIRDGIWKTGVRKFLGTRAQLSLLWGTWQTAQQGAKL